MAARLAANLPSSIHAHRARRPAPGRVVQPGIHEAREQQDHGEPGRRDEQIRPAAGRAAAAGEPVHDVAGEADAFEDRSERAGREQGGGYREEHRREAPALEAQRQAVRDQLPEIGAGEEDNRSDDDGGEEVREPRGDEGGDDQGGQEAEDDARQARHQLDDRLDPAAQPRAEELAREDRGQQRDRHAEHERVDGGLEGAEDQRHQAELRLEVVGRRGGLPDVLRAGSPLVPDGQEERSRAGLRVPGVEAPVREAPAGERDDPVVLRGERGCLHPPPRGGRETRQQFVARDVPHLDRPVGETGDEDPRARGAVDRGDGAAGALEEVRPGQDRRGVRRAPGGEPGADAPRGVADEDRGPPEQPGDGGQGAPALLEQRDRLDDRRGCGVAQQIARGVAVPPGQQRAVAAVREQEPRGRRPAGRQRVRQGGRRAAGHDLAGHHVLAPGEAHDLERPVGVDLGVAAGVARPAAVQQQHRGRRCAGNGLLEGHVKLLQADLGRRDAHRRPRPPRPRERPPQGAAARVGRLRRRRTRCENRWCRG